MLLNLISEYSKAGSKNKHSKRASVTQKGNIIQDLIYLSTLDQDAVSKAVKLAFLNSVNRVIQFDNSIVNGSSHGFKILVDSLIYCLADENTEISESSREILRDLIKNYKKFTEVIPKLSFVNRQDLLFVIGRTDVLFRSTLNFSHQNSIKSQSIYRQTNLTVGSDRYKSENLSTQVPDNTTYKIKGTMKDTMSKSLKTNSKK
jgi:hypothetical protein